MVSNLPRGRTEHTDTLRALPYRPTFKLARCPEPPYCGQGWKRQAFKDERGSRYERDRDGEWERWWLVTERRKGDHGRVLYRADRTKKKPDDHRDCLDRIDDLRFAAAAITGLIEDAQERGLFPAEQLRSMERTARELQGHASSLTPAIQESAMNGHA